MAQGSVLAAPSGSRARCPALQKTTSEGRWLPDKQARRRWSLDDLDLRGGDIKGSVERESGPGQEPDLVEEAEHGR